MRYLHVLLVFSYCLVGCSHVNHLPVVKTYADILRQPAIVVPSAHKSFAKEPHITSVRLGQSAVSAPINSAVLLYCFTEHFDDLAGHETNVDRLGPLWVSVTHEKGICFDQKQKYLSMSRYEPQTTEDTQLVFIRPVVIDRPGKYFVRIMTDEGKEIAATTIIGTEEVAQPWTPFYLDKDSEWDWVSRSEYTFRLVSKMELSVLGRGAGLPQCDGYYELYQGEMVTGLAGRHMTGTRGPNDPLPALIDEQPALVLTKDGDVLTVSDKSSRNLRANGADLNYLARWWINGKPYFSTKDQPQSATERGTEHSASDVPFILHFDPARIGARPGDVVSMQLLICGSWDFVTNPATDEWAANSPGRVSNRISWRVPVPTGAPN